MGHVATMTFTAALGLMAMFMVDLLDLYFLSRLNDTAVTAGNGFAGPPGFRHPSMGVGSGLGAAALVAATSGRAIRPGRGILPGRASPSRSSSRQCCRWSSPVFPR